METRALRIEAHGLIDPMWKDKKAKRSDIYQELKEKFGVKHIGESDAETCKKIIAWAKDV